MKKSLKKAQESSIKDVIMLAYGMNDLITFNVNKAKTYIRLEDSYRSTEFESDYRGVPYSIIRHSIDKSLECTIMFENIKYNEINSKKLFDLIEELQSIRFTSIEMYENSKNGCLMIYINADYFGKNMQVDLIDTSILKHGIYPYRTLSYINLITIDCINLVLDLKRKEDNSSVN